MFARVGRFRTQLLVNPDRRRRAVVSSSMSSPGGTASGRAAGSPHRDEAWRAEIDLGDARSVRPATASVFDTMLPDARQVADPFHVVRVANQAFDECRRRVQNDTLGHRGRRHDPLYRARRRLTIAANGLSDDSARPARRGLLRAGDPRQEVWFAWNAKEVVRQIYDHTDV